MIIDAATWIGSYPFRTLPKCDVSHLLAGMDRVGIDRALVGYLPAAFVHDPNVANTQLFEALQTHQDRLALVPTIHAGLPAWQEDLAAARDHGACAVRVYPMHQAPDATEDDVAHVAAASCALGLPVILTTRFEDVRQRHPLDVAADLPPSLVRGLVRSHADVRVIVTQASRDFIEEVHFGLTPTEATRVLWDVSWIWGPPSDDLATLLRTIGGAHFTFGTGAPLRLPEATVAKLELTEMSDATRAAIASENLLRWIVWPR